MGNTQYYFRHTHYYTGDDGSSNPNGSKTICTIPPIPELAGTWSTIYLASRGTNGTESAYTALGSADNLTSSLYALDRWSYQRSGISPSNYINQPILYSTSTSYWYDPFDGSASVLLDSQNFQGFQVILGDKLVMGGNIREEWTVTGVASPHTFTPPPTEGESTTTSYWHKIGILEIGILFVATIDNINFFSSDIVPVVSVSTSTDFTSGNSVTLNNIFTDPLFLAVHPDYPIPEISSFTRYSPWRQYFFNSISSDGSSISVSLTDPSIWTNGGTNVLNGFNYFQDPEYIVTIPGNPTLSAFLSWTYLPSQDYTHIGMVIQDEDRTIFAGTPEGQAILNGPAPIAGQSNVIEKYITLQPSGTVQVKRFGW